MIKKIRKTAMFGAVLMGMSLLVGCGGEDDTGDDPEEVLSENTQPACSDSVDNDGNGAIDCDDAQCAAFCPQGWQFPEWPAGQVPAEIGKLVAERFVADPLGSTPMYYAQAVTWYGALTTAKLLGDQDLLNRLITRFDPVLTEEGADYISWEVSVDARVVGIVPLEIYMNNQNQGCYDIGMGLADAQWESPQGSGITREARMWSDDMFMITGLQTQAFRATQDPVYRDRMALTMVKYLDALQQENGLFFHTRSSRIHWNRGNGWSAVGMVELLSEMTPEHEHYARIMEGYTKMMAGLLAVQAPEGIWRQVLDDGTAWLEASGSAMFAFAFISGVKNGWLDGETYGPAAVKAWTELVTNHMDPNGDLRDVCIGTGQGYEEGGEDLEAQLQYYLSRPTTTGDYHGQAPLLFAVSALLR